VFETNHVLDPVSIGTRRWDLHRDSIVVLLDEEHLRVAWSLMDRVYG
jgi:hypothetical protein